MPRWFRYETREGPPILAGGRAFTPVARSLRISLPGRPVGLIWNRPTAVWVHEPGGKDQLLPIVDQTRVAQLWILGSVLFNILLFGLFVRARRR